MDVDRSGAARNTIGVAVSNLDSLSGIRRTKASSFAASSIAAVTTLTLLYVLFVPRWETNDDVAMSMVAHGYGIAAVGSPNIIFSNALWGCIVRLLPTINGVLGYSIASIGVLLATWSATLYFLQRAGVGSLVSFFTTLLVFARPSLFPQFTINAGLLSVTAILAILDYFRTKELTSLVAGCVFAFIGYLVRSQEFVFVIVISSPLLADKAMRSDRRYIFALFVLLGIIAIAWVFDYWCYASPAWDAFKKLNLSRAPFTDFGAASEFLRHPEILRRHGFSSNDIELVENFFFVDSQVSDPRTLAAMLRELGPSRFFAGTFSDGFSSVATVASPTMLPTAILAALLLAIRPSCRAAISWVIMVAALFIMGLLGRGGVTRVDAPAIALLCLVGLLQALGSEVNAARKHSRVFDRFALLFLGIVLTTCVVQTCWTLFAEVTTSASYIKEQQGKIRDFPHEPVVIWGAALPFESVFPVLATDSSARSMRLFPFGVFTRAPLSVAAKEEAKGLGFIERISSSKGMLMIADPSNMERLRIWCAERLSGELLQTTVQDAPRVKIERAWCRR